MERRHDWLLRTVVDQLAQRLRAPGFRLSQRGTTALRRWVEFTGPRLAHDRGERQLRVYHAPDYQYVAAHLREAGSSGPPRRAMLWSYDPDSTSPTDPEVLPFRVADWADTIVRRWPV